MSETFTTEELDTLRHYLFHLDRKLLREPGTNDGCYWIGNEDRQPLWEFLTKEQVLNIMEQKRFDWAEQCGEACKANGLSDWQERAQTSIQKAHELGDFITELRTERYH